MDKIKKLRRLLEVPEELRIGQHISNKMDAHDYNDLFFIPDDVLVEILKDKNDFAKNYTKN